MVGEFVRSFPAKGLVLPVIRDLVAMIKAEKERARYAPAAPPPALDRDVDRHAAHLAHTLEQLCLAAEIRDGELPRVTDLVRTVPARGAGTDVWNKMLDEVVSFCRTHHAAFREAVLRDKALFRLDYLERVRRTNVLLLHGQRGEEQASNIAGSLRDGCYYEAEHRELTTLAPKDSPDLQAIYAADPDDLRRGIPRWTPDVVLSDVGSAKRGFDMKIGRYLARLDRTQVSVLYRPFSSNRLLGTFENARIRKLSEPSVSVG